MVELMPDHYALSDRKCSGIENRSSGDADRRAFVAHSPPFPVNPF